MRIELLEQSWEKFIMLEVCKVGLEKLCNVCPILYSESHINSMADG